MMERWVASLAAAAVFVVCAAVSHAADTREDGAPPVRIALTPVIMDERLELLDAWGEYFEERLERPVEFVRRSSYAGVVELLQSGEADLAWLCGYPYVRHQARLELVAVPTHAGAPVYRSYIIAGAESEARAFSDLAGRVFAYADPLSNSGWLYPNVRILEEGRQPGSFFRQSFFTWNHREVIRAVAQGVADGGAVDGYIYETLRQEGADVIDRVRVIERSPEFGFPPLVAAPHAEAGMVEDFRAALLAMSGSERGQAVLDGLNLDGFVVKDERHYHSIRAMAQFYREGGS